MQRDTLCSFVLLCDAVPLPGHLQFTKPLHRGHACFIRVHAAVQAPFKVVVCKAVAAQGLCHHVVEVNKSLCEVTVSRVFSKSSDPGITEHQGDHFAPLSTSRKSSKSCIAECHERSQPQ